MGGRALSERVKKQKLLRAKDEQMNAAILEWETQHQDCGEDVDDQQKSLRDIADHHGMSKSTLARRVQEGQSIREFNVTKQLLLTAEKTVLVQFILESADCGFPLNHV